MQSHLGDVDEIDKSKIGTLTALQSNSPYQISRRCRVSFTFSLLAV